MLNREPMGMKLNPRCPHPGAILSFSAQPRADGDEASKMVSIISNSSGFSAQPRADGDEARRNAVSDGS